jgi:transposase
LLIITLEGYLTYDILYGEYTTAYFNNFIRIKVLPKINPFPALRSILILNNTSYYRSQELKEIYKEAGIVLKFLSPYSLDFNLIKELFLALKA